MEDKRAMEVCESVDQRCKKTSVSCMNRAVLAFLSCF